MQLFTLMGAFFLVYFIFAIQITANYLENYELKTFNDTLTPIFYQKLVQASFITDHCYQKLENESRDLVNHLSKIYQDALTH